jgi:hypothetical protein
MAGILVNTVGTPGEILAQETSPVVITADGRILVDIDS